MGAILKFEEIQLIVVDMEQQNHSNTNNIRQNLHLRDLRQNQSASYPLSTAPQLTETPTPIPAQPSAPLHSRCSTPFVTSVTYPSRLPPWPTVNVGYSDCIAPELNTAQ